MYADYYVYMLSRPNCQPCYIGMGRKDRWKKHGIKARNPHLRNIIINAGGDIPRVKIQEGLTRDLAFELEVALIALIGREVNGGTLVNMSDGGDGGSTGMRHSEEWRAHRSKKAKEVWSRPEYVALQSLKKIGNSNSKKPHKLSPEWRKELTEKMKGNKFTLGVPISEKSRAAIKAVWDDSERRAKLLATRRENGTYLKEAIAKRVQKRRENILLKKLNGAN